MGGHIDGRFQECPVKGDVDQVVLRCVFKEPACADTRATLVKRASSAAAQNAILPILSRPEASVQCVTRVHSANVGVGFLNEIQNVLPRGQFQRLQGDCVGLSELGDLYSGIHCLTRPS